MEQAPQSDPGDTNRFADESSPAPSPTPTPSFRKRALKWIYWLAYRLRTFLITPLRQEFAAVEAAVANAHGALAGAQLEAATQLIQLQRQLARVEAAQGHQLNTLHAEMRELRAQVATLPPMMGPRFDELEIKVRPLIAYDDESYAVRLADGYLMAPRSEPTFTVMLANAPSGGLEAGTRRVLRALIEPGMAIADVGANVGLLTLACARATGPAGQVHAFEPEPGPRRQLEKTCALNGLSWVAVHPTAVGRTSEHRVFHVSPIIGHSSLYPLPEAERGAARDLEVEVVTLDDAIDPDVLLDVVKIDVEGAELDVLGGMTRHIAGNRDLAIVAEFGPSHLERLDISPDAWWAAFRERGFVAYAIAEPGGACAPITLEAALQEISTNIVFVRAGSRAEQRLPRA